MNSVRIISTNEQVVKSALKEYTDQLKKRPEVLAVFLCGSWARGLHSPYSDIDLFILIKKDGQKPYDRVPLYLPDRFPLSLDLFIYTQDELENSQFARKLLEHSIQLYVNK